MLNTIVLVGRLTKDVELFESKDSTTGKFYLAFDQGKEDTGFIKCVLFNEVANSCAEFLHKGDKVAVTGRFYDSQFERKDGSKGHEAQILVNSIEFVDVIFPKEEEKPQEPVKEEKPVARPRRK